MGPRGLIAAGQDTDGQNADGQNSGQGAVGQAPFVGQAATVGVADPFKPDAKGMIMCRGCDAMCKDIRKHLTKTRNSMKCESKYSRAELS